ncbi:hypothetical protein VP01_1988g3 [Puccinia sorghi]|uniref:Uncharacterized protein n=1 Tax=Puccinia sorghi TaxID=27349 RepID=A0A0L6VC52_9BASI|nr:hypothetical protein VP01_1988g3 [Puccinia sorghi]
MLSLCFPGSGHLITHAKTWVAQFSFYSFKSLSYFIILPLFCVFLSYSFQVFLCVSLFFFTSLLILNCLVVKSLKSLINSCFYDFRLDLFLGGMILEKAKSNMWLVVPWDEIDKEEWIWLNRGWEEEMWLNNGSLFKPEAEICCNPWIIVDLVKLDTRYYFFLTHTVLAHLKSPLQDFFNCPGFFCLNQLLFVSNHSFIVSILALKFPCQFMAWKNSLREKFNHLNQSQATSSLNIHQKITFSSPSYPFLQPFQMRNLGMNWFQFLQSLPLSLIVAFFISTLSILVFFQVIIIVDLLRESHYMGKSLLQKNIMPVISRSKINLMIKMKRIIHAQGLTFFLEMVITHISYGHHFTLIFFFYVMIALRIRIKALLVSIHQFLNPTSTGSSTPENPNHGSLTQLSQKLNICLLNTHPQTHAIELGRPTKYPLKANPLFFSLEDEPIPLPIFPNPAFKYSKATVSSFCLCVFWNDREETPMPSSGIILTALRTIVSTESQHALHNQPYFSTLLLIKALFLYSFIMTSSKMISNQIRTKFTKNQAKFYMTKSIEGTLMQFPWKNIWCDFMKKNEFVDSMFNPYFEVNHVKPGKSEKNINHPPFSQNRRGQIYEHYHLLLHFVSRIQLEHYCFVFYEFCEVPLFFSHEIGLVLKPCPYLNPIQSHLNKSVQISSLTLKAYFDSNFVTNKTKVISPFLSLSFFAKSSLVFNNLKTTMIFFDSLHKFLLIRVSTSGSKISTKRNFQVSFFSKTMKNPMNECFVVSTRTNQKSPDDSLKTSGSCYRNSVERTLIKDSRICYLKFNGWADNKNKVMKYFWGLWLVVQRRGLLDTPRLFRALFWILEISPYRQNCCLKDHYHSPLLQGKHYY